MSINRTYELIIAAPPAIEEDGKTSYRKVDPAAIKITDLRMTAQVDKDATQGEADTSNIVLYNPTKEIISKAGKEHAIVILKAGYDGNNKGIFYGKVKTTSTSKEVTDILLTIEVGDGFDQVTNNKASVQAKKGETKKAFWKKLASSFKGVSIGRIDVNESLLKKTTYEKGVTANGYLKDLLNKYVKSEGHRWFITDGKLYIQPEKDPLLVEAVTLSANNIRSTVRPMVDSSEHKGSSNNRSGLKINTFLDGRIGPESVIRLDDTIEDFKGTYVVDKVSHTLDNREGEYSTTIETKGVVSGS